MSHFFLQPPRPAASAPRLKRSRRLTLTTLMAGASVSLTACGGDYDTPRSAQWEDRPALEQGAPTDAFAYASLDQCLQANDMPDDACRTAAKTAEEDGANSAPRFDQQASCEDVYGAGQCVPRSQANGQGSFFTPLLTGFIVGQMMNGGWRGTGLYRDNRDGGFYTPYGGRAWRDYSTGRTKIGANSLDPPASYKAIPPKVQTRASVISRGGFGGRMSSQSYGGGHWGG